MVFALLTWNLKLLAVLTFIDSFTLSASSPFRTVVRARLYSLNITSNKRRSASITDDHLQLCFIITKERFCTFVSIRWTINIAQ